MTRIRSHARAACLLAAALAAAGCGAMSAPTAAAPKGAGGSGAAPSPAPSAAHALDGTAWMLASLAGRPVSPEAGATLRFDGERVSGGDGCNRFTGPWTAGDATLRIGPNLAATQRACPEPERMLATGFGRMLLAAQGWRIDGAALVLLGEGGTPLAAFAPQPTGLAGTRWHVTGYNTGRGAVTGVAEAPGSPTALTIEFDPSGGVRGSAGCNTYSGAWTESGGRLSVGPLRTTRMACAVPPDAMQREAAFLRALESAASARREGVRLELRTASDALAISASALPAR
jgi:heat shock protein HslJ